MGGEPPIRHIQLSSTDCGDESVQAQSVGSEINSFSLVCRGRGGLGNRHGVNRRGRFFRRFLRLFQERLEPVGER
jgi:hypothetical protein